MTPSPEPSDLNQISIQDLRHVVHVEDLTQLTVPETNSNTVVVEGDTLVTIQQQPANRVIVSATGLQGPAGPQGLQGQPGAGASEQYVHAQTVPASVWTVVHNMGRRPPVSVIDSANEEVEGEVRYPDLNTTVLTFSGAFSGIATLGG